MQLCVPEPVPAAHEVLPSFSGRVLAFSRCLLALRSNGDSHGSLGGGGSLQSPRLASRPRQSSQGRQTTMRNGFINVCFPRLLYLELQKRAVPVRLILLNTTRHLVAEKALLRRTQHTFVDKNRGPNLYMSETCARSPH